MTIRVNKQEAEKQISHLIAQVLNGEEIVISVGDQEIARILPSIKLDQNVNKRSEQQQRTPGLLKGKLGDSFFEPLPEEELKAWEQSI